MPDTFFYPRRMLGMERNIISTFNIRAVCFDKFWLTRDMELKPGGIITSAHCKHILKGTEKKCILKSHNQVEVIILS